MTGCSSPMKTRLRPQWGVSESVPVDVTLPRLGQGMESGTIVRWLKAEGDRVGRGEPLYELDTEKVTQEVEAEVAGVLVRIIVREGDVEVGVPVAVIEPDADSAAAPAQVAESTAPPAATPAPPRAEPVAAATQPASVPAVSSGRLKASPLARRVARERGFDLSAVAGTGPEGRILAEDVERAAGGSPAPRVPVTLPPPEVEVVQLTSIRKTIARRLGEAWTAPVFQLGVSADMSELLGLRERLVERAAEGVPTPTVNDLLVKLSAVALVRHPALNALFTGDAIHRYPSAHVGIAVAAPQGLVVPVIRGADRLSVAEIARARADLVGRARENRLTLQDLEGGTFTISNLGMFGVEQFVAVLNPPQVAILAVGATKDTPVVVEGELEIAPIARLTLTCDHRAIDGADGARFLQTLVALIEQPALAL